MKGERERAMVVIERNTSGKPTVWCDPEIADLVRVLNANGFPTRASCSGHGYRPASIILRDGRELHIARNREEGRMIEALFPLDINGRAIARTQEERDDGENGSSRI